MKLSAQEEYGLRCLLQLARHGSGASLTVPEISQAEGLSSPNVAKLLRVLRQEGFADSVRGQYGGYILARSPDRILVSAVVDALGGRLYDPEFCANHGGSEDQCAHSPAACSVRTLWNQVQVAVDQVLNRITLQDLLGQGRRQAADSSGVGSRLLDISRVE